MKTQKLKVGYVPLVKKSWLNNSLKATRSRAVAMLEGMDVEVCQLPGLIYEQAQAEKLEEFFLTRRIDCLVFHHVTFSLGSIIPHMACRLHVPAISWAMPESPMDGGRISSNSFCAATMNSHTLWKLGEKYATVYADIGEAPVELGVHFRALHCAKALRNAKFGIFGNRVPGFYTSNFNELLLKKVFGVQVEHVDLLELTETSNAIRNTSRVEAPLRSMKRRGVSAGEIKKTARLVGAFRAISKKYKLDALAVKCWPELEDFYELAPCAALGMLTNSGLCAGCEGDIYGTLTMFVQRILSGGHPFFCDFVVPDFKANEALLWHCGAAPAKLSAEQADCVLCKHSVVNGGGVMGVTCEFPLKGGRVTFGRISEDREGYRAVFATGRGLPTEQILKGNPLKVRFDSPLREITNTILDNGFEHHFSLIHADISRELAAMCKWLDIKLYNF